MYFFRRYIKVKKKNKREREEDIPRDMREKISSLSLVQEKVFPKKKMQKKFSLTKHKKRKENGFCANDAGGEERSH